MGFFCKLFWQAGIPEKAFIQLRPDTKIADKFSER